MKFFANAKELSHAAAACVKASLKGTNAGVLGGILVKADGNTINLTGYDMTTGIQTTVSAIVQESGVAVFDARIADILSKLPSEQATITVEIGTATIEGGDATYNLVCMRPDDFPALPNYELEQSISIPKDTLLSMVRQTAFSAAVKDSKPVHTGVKFDISAGMIEASAVDGARLAVRKEPISYNGENRSLIIPASALNNMAALMAKEKDENVEIFAGKRHVAFRTEGYTVHTRLLEGDFIDYHKALPKTSSTTITADVEELQASIERSSIIIDDRLLSPLRCKIGNGNVQFNAQTALGAATDTMAAEIDGDDLEIGLNFRFLLDALKAAETDRVRLQFGGAFSPVTITPVDGDSFLFLILPMRMREK